MIQNLGWRGNSWSWRWNNRREDGNMEAIMSPLKTSFFSLNRHQPKPKRAFQLWHFTLPSEVWTHLCGSAGFNPEAQKAVQIVWEQGDGTLSTSSKHLWTQARPHSAVLSLPSVAVFVWKGLITLIPDGKWISCLLGLSGIGLAYLMHTGDIRHSMLPFFTTGRLRAELAVLTGKAVPLLLTCLFTEQMWGK